jgi:excisionase family DNA binding protein
MTKIYNAVEATKYLRISRNHLYVLLSRGEIESTMIGCRRLFTEGQLQRFIDSCAVGKR